MKILCRTGPGVGKGEIIVTTRSGGEGTCTVTFRGYMEKIGIQYISNNLVAFRDMVVCLCVCQCL